MQGNPRQDNQSHQLDESSLNSSFHVQPTPNFKFANPILAESIPPKKEQDNSEGSQKNQSFKLSDVLVSGDSNEASLQDGEIKRPETLASTGEGSTGVLPNLVQISPSLLCPGPDPNG